ncbi:MAG: hypothetical protein GY810_10950 [Aureispira sp.]|nr:hypothetical protein [Aureispira sp.]
MDNTLASSIIPLLPLAVLLIGLVLLVKQKQIGWIAIMAAPFVEHFGSSFFGFFSFGFLYKSWVYQLAIIILGAWGYNQWKTSTTHTVIQGSQSDILDDFGTETRTTAIHRTTSIEKRQLLIAFCSFSALLGLYEYFFRFGQLLYLEPLIAAFTLSDILFLTGIYALSKHNIEGWPILISASVLSLGTEFFVYIEDSPFQLSQGIDFAQLMIASWGYTKWEKHTSYSN